MKIKWIFVVLMIAVLMLTGCQSAESTQAPDQESEEGSTSEQVVDEGQAQDAYPAPVEIAPITEDAYPDPLYPDIVDGSEVEWEQAEAIILNGEVSLINLQSETMRVTMGLKDGRLLVVVIEGAAQVHETLASCGDLCRNVVFTQE